MGDERVLVLVCIATIPQALYMSARDSTISNREESFAHLVSRRIVQFAHERGATILVFEHLVTIVRPPFCA